VNIAICLTDPPGATVVILDNLGLYCDVANIFIRQRQIQIVPCMQVYIPYNLIFATKCNDSSILITIISWDYLNLSLANEYVGDVIIVENIYDHSSEHRDKNQDGDILGDYDTCNNVQRIE
jgi:hypothetical protein